MMRYYSPFATGHSPFRRTAGFTLIEVLVASGLLALTMGSVLRLSQITIRNQDVAVERSQANQLIQEATEIVHQVRDTNVHDVVVNTAWDEGLPPAGSTSAPVWNGTNRRWQWVVNAIEPAISGGVETIHLAGLKFTRTVRFDVPSVSLAKLTDETGQEIIGGLASQLRQVTVEVKWRSHGEDWVERGTTFITNWQGA